VTELSRFAFEVLRQDEDFILYRGRSADGSSQVLLRSPVSQHPTPQNLKRLQAGYFLKEELDSAWAVRPIEIANHWDRTVLVMEDPGGVPLDQLLGQPLELAISLRIAISLSSAIGHLHRRGIIHKDIKPAHVLVTPNTGQCWLMGFGICSRVPRKRQSPEPPEFIDGTLPYMAPEQTGRMNRSIDSRSDLYSFGVLFYEMLTGGLPFTASDPMEWVHCHIARQAVPPSQRVEGVPAAISAIAMKLLAKTAEERYQTAIGVEYDLRQCLDLLEGSRPRDPFVRRARIRLRQSEGEEVSATEATSDRQRALPGDGGDGGDFDAIPAFLLGEHDIPNRLLIPEKLYGRVHDVDTLLAAFDRVAKNGTPELVLVSGYSGIGKSSVVHELHKALVRTRGLFAAGKFDHHKRDIPYSTLAQAFQSLVRSLLAKNDIQLRSWRDDLLQALDPYGRLIVDIVPELKLIVGEPAPIPELPPQDAQRHFRQVLRQFVSVFARPEHPLALFLDDLQWLDAATLGLLEELLTGADMQHLMLIGAYRNNEVNSAHPLARKLEAIHRDGGKVQEIILAPLAQQDLERLVADSLHCKMESAIPLARLIHEKTAGNPFFAIQFLSELTEEGLLIFDHAGGQWIWDLNRIRAKGYTDNVVELMVGRLNRLPVQTQRALQELACLGNGADIATVAAVRGAPEEQVQSDLWEALRLELITHSEGSYQFTHDRIQEAAYSLLPEQSRADLHLHISRSLLAKMTSNEVEDDLFEIANQFNLGSTLIFDRDEKDLVAELNLRAGKKAKASAAYNSACTYLSAGMALAGKDVWERRYELAFGLWIERAESELLSGNFDEAERLIGYSLERANSKIRKVAAYRLEILLHLMRGYRTINAHMEALSESLEAVNSGLECLLLFGIEMPARPTREHVHLECEEIWQDLGSRSIESLIDLPVMTDSEARAAMDLLSVLTAPAFRTNVNLMFVFFCRMVKITLTHGISAASAHGIADFATILGPIFHRYGDGYRFGDLACRLIERHKFNAFKTKVYFCVQRTMIWTQSIQTAIDYIRLAIESVAETHDLAYASFSWNHLVEVLLLQGARLDEVWRESQNGIDFIRKIKFQDEDGILHWHRRFILTLRGEAGANGPVLVDQFSDPNFEAGLETMRKACETGSRQYHLAFIVFLYWTLKMQVQYLFGDYHAANCAAQKAKLLLWSAEQHMQSVNYFYYTALTATAHYESVDVPERLEMLAMARESLSWLREWAESNPGTFLDKYSLVMAEVARIEGRHLEAIHLYEQAVRTARENGFVQNEAIANELAAKFYFSLHHETSAYAYLRNASYCYLRWGALAKVRQLEQQHPQLKEQDKTIGWTSTIDAAVEHLDLGILIKVSQAVSSEIILEKLINTLMRTAIEHAGAERGLLILQKGERQRIQAEATTRQGGIVVALQESSVSEGSVPESILLYAMRTRENVVLSDASAEHAFSGDLYILRHHPRSVLCLPLINQGQVTGLLYLENNLVPNAFTSSRVAVLKMLASQAAISLENTRLYSDLQRGEEELRKAHAELAHVARIITLGELSASIAHEISQPLGAVANHASACLRWLNAQNLEEARRSASLAVEKVHRAGEIIGRIRALAAKTPPQKEWLDINLTIGEVVALAGSELQGNQVSLQTVLADDLPSVSGDRIQLQQVLLNLVINAVEAMSQTSEGLREIRVSSQKMTEVTCVTNKSAQPNETSNQVASTHVLVAVRDSGPGLDPRQIEQIFDAFYTTKPRGLGMGLAISRSIVEAHGGRLWAGNGVKGAVFQFKLPIFAGGAVSSKR
jgi:predicted ATPase/signal transduction histidine kinase